MMKTLIHHPLLAVLSWGALYAASSAHAVENGIEATQGEFPYVYGLSLKSSDQRTGGCTATLVAPRLLLTAAHCFENGVELVGLSNASSVSLESGGYADGISIADYRTHPDYKTISLKKSEKTGENAQDALLKNIQKYAPIDIAYIKLKKDAPVRQLPKIRILETEEERTQARFADVWVVGYGSNRFQRENTSSTLGSGVKRYGRKTLSTVSLGWFGLDDQDRNILPGDSGGPLLRETSDGFEILGHAHTYVPSLRAVTYETKRGKTKTRKEVSYFFSVETAYTKENLCWVVKNSGISIDGVDCADSN